MMKSRLAVLTAVMISSAVLGLNACASLVGGPVGNRSVPQPAKSVNPARYSGLWFELARYDNRFERNCEAVTAQYRLRSDGMIGVVNRCRMGSPTGPAKMIEGRAKDVDGARFAKLKVAFFGPFWGDYWVLDHADDYTWSIVGEPSGRFLWILARAAHPGRARRDELQARAVALGYDPALIRWTAQ